MFLFITCRYSINILIKKETPYYLLKCNRLVLLFMLLPTKKKGLLIVY